METIEQSQVIKPKSKSNEANKRWRLNNPLKYLESAKRYRESHHEQVLEYSRKWYRKNKQKSKENTRRWHQNNREKVNAEKREWRRKNPEKRKIIEQNRLKRIQEAYNYDGISQVSFLLTIWSNSIREKYHNMCQICGNLAIHTHHLLQKQHHPDLALNENNGIPLCMICHNEVHGRKMSQ